MIVTWFPCYLQPISVFSLGPWNVKPGLRAGPMSDSEKVLWRDSCAHLPPFKERFEPNFLVQIDKRDFTDGLLERLRDQGHDRRELLKTIPPEFGEELPLLAEDILRWVIVSLSLCRTFNEITLPALRYEFRHGDTPGQLIPSGCCATHAGHDRSMYTMVSHHHGLASSLDLDILNKLATAIEPYYQPIQWRYAPVSVALSCFWAFLFSRFPDQAYTSLVTILEALLSTGTAEIAHQVSERVAVLIGHSSDERLEVYRAIKKLYDLRSRITHGDLEPKKGPMTWNSTIISAKMTVVSMPTLTEMARYATAVLCAVLESSEMMSAMVKKKDVRKQSLEEFFLTQLFS
jgi:hypothetical protein